MTCLRYLLVSAAVIGLALAASCGGAPPPPPPAAAKPAPAEPADPAVLPPAPPPKPHALRLEEAEAAQVLGPELGKLLAQLSLLAPKTHEAVLKSYLWKPAAECEDLRLAPVEPVPGLLVPKGEPPKLRTEVVALLKEAAAVAKQRGTAIEVLAGHEPVSEAVQRWNRAVLEAALATAKAASPAERKEKSVMGAARKRLDPEADPRSWSEAPCTSGRLGGFSVVVQLVALDASGGRGAVLVKGGAEGDRFEKETYEATYWNKAKGKNYRLLTEIMSAGRFVRQCSEASHFTAVPDQEGTWRCREDSESWEPANRPLPAWQ